MRGIDHQQSQMFSYLSPETRVRKDHPLRAIRVMVDEILAQLSRRFDSMYASAGRPSIPPEKLLRAQLLQMLYSIRSERLLMEEIDYSVLFRWFVGLNLDEEVWDATTFTKNRDRLLEAEVAEEFLAQVVERARSQGLTSDEHFTVDGTLLEAWAGARVSIAARFGEQDRHLKREDMAPVDVLVQAIVIARPIAQQERRRPRLSPFTASRAKNFVLGGVADRDAQNFVPAVGDRRQPSIEIATKRADGVGQRVGEILVFAPTKTVARHHDAGAEASVVLVQVRERAAGLRRQEVRRDRRAERAEVGLERRPVQGVDCRRGGGESPLSPCGRGVRGEGFGSAGRLAEAR